MAVESTPNMANDEIDLGELLKTLWKGRWLIIGITAFSIASAAGYAFSSTPIYEAEGAVIAPHVSDIADFNLGLTAEAGLTPLTPNDVFPLFLSNLQSEVSKYEFFERVYLPSLSEGDAKQRRDALYTNFLNGSFKVQPIDKNRPDIFVVRIQHTDPQTSVEWVREYIKSVSVKTRQEVIKNVAKDIFIKKANIESLIDEERATAKKVRSDRLEQLREALVVAKAVNIVKPQITTARAPAQDKVAAYIDGSEMYARGSLALESEIRVLESRKSDDPFIASLRGLEKQRALMGKVKNDIQSLRVYRFYKNVNPPESPIKPKRALIISLGAALGIVVAGLLVLIRSGLRKSTN